MFSQNHPNKNTTDDANASAGLRHTTESNVDKVTDDSAAALTTFNSEDNTTGSNALSLINQSNLSNSSENYAQLKAKSTVTISDPQTKITPYNCRSITDAYIPSIQSTQLSKQNELTSIPYEQRLINIMEKNGVTFRIVHNKTQYILCVDGPELDIVICMGVSEKDGSSKKCNCNKYYPPEFELLGDSCHFCYHPIGLHRLKPELERIVYDDTKSESERNEYKYWFDKFCELQQLYCYTDKNLPFDDNLFIKIYDQSRQASISFIQSPNYRYVLVKYTYAGVYDEGESLYETKYRIISLQTMLPIKTEEDLIHSWSFFRDNTRMEYGFRTVLWDLDQPATLIATSVNDDSDQPFIEKIINIEFPNID